MSKGENPITNKTQQGFCKRYSSRSTASMDLRKQAKDEMKEGGQTPKIPVRKQDDKTIQLQICPTTQAKEGIGQRKNRPAGATGTEAKGRVGRCPEGQILWSH